MAKGYWIAHVEVSDPGAYKAYIAANGAVFAKFGGRFLVRNGASEMREGALRSRHVVIEFKDYATARACYDSPEYRAVLRLRADVSAADLVVIEGYDGPQPATGQ
jgi:uncharacterized protein (DUF1330 family)